MTLTVEKVGRTPQGALKVADLLEKGGYDHMIRHRHPFWCPPMPDALRQVVKASHVPALGWDREIRDGAPMTDIDQNAAYLSAASSARFAHGALENRGPWRDDEFIKPGYYLVDVHPWALDAPGSPLGTNAKIGTRVPVAHPTYRLLRDLTFGASWTPGGHWPDATAHDSWTCETSWPMSTWTNALRDLRAEIIDFNNVVGHHGPHHKCDPHECDYEALKMGYSQAVQMWNTPPDPKGTPPGKREKHSKAYRPDWYDTLLSQHAATMWRHAYRASLAGHPPVSLLGRGLAKDGMAFRTRDLSAVLVMPKTPIRLDATGKALGTFKQSRRYMSGQDRADGSM